MGVTQTEMAERMGLSMSYISQLEGDKRTPSDAVETLLRMLEEQMDAGMMDSGSTLREDAKPYGSQRQRREKRIPIIGWAHAGDASVYDEMPADWQETMATDCPKEKVFAVRLEGDSMEPRFADGDVLVVMSEEAPYSGCFAVVKFRNEGVVFRRIELTGGMVRLMPINDRYPTSEYPIEDFEWIHPVWGRFTQMWKR
jgi:SOS-response transcriptional repressor LexA